MAYSLPTLEKANIYGLLSMLAPMLGKRECWVLGKHVGKRLGKLRMAGFCGFLGSVGKHVGKRVGKTYLYIG